MGVCGIFSAKGYIQCRQAIRYSFIWSRELVPFFMGLKASSPIDLLQYKNIAIIGFKEVRFCKIFLQD